MMSKLVRIFRSAPLLASAFAVALLLTLWFGGQSIARAIYWADPQHQNQDVAGWMTVGYIARSWQVPPSELASELQRLPPILHMLPLAPLQSCSKGAWGLSV